MSEDSKSGSDKKPEVYHYKLNDNWQSRLPIIINFVSLWISLSTMVLNLRHIYTHNINLQKYKCNNFIYTYIYYLCLAIRKILENTCRIHRTVFSSKNLLSTSKVGLKQQHCRNDTPVIISLFHYLGPFQQQLLRTSIGNVGIYPLVGCFTASKATFRTRTRTGQKTENMRTSPGRKGVLLLTGPTKSPSQQEQLCELRLREEDLLPYHLCLQACAFSWL